jgi:hypothetical protein
MSNARAIYDRYRAAAQVYAELCATDPQTWHRPNVAEFSELNRLLLPHAESGDMLCQYALATILWMGLGCDSENEFQTGYSTAIAEATRWWIAAAMQGFWPALDNLVSSGVGAQAKRASEAFRELEQARPDLVGWSHGMPIYGPEFVQELCKRLYGQVVTDSG